MRFHGALQGSWRRFGISRERSYGAPGRFRPSQSDPAPRRGPFPTHRVNFQLCSVIGGAYTVLTPCLHCAYTGAYTGLTRGLHGAYTGHAARPSKTEPGGPLALRSRVSHTVSLDISPPAARSKLRGGPSDSPPVHCAPGVQRWKTAVFMTDSYDKAWDPPNRQKSACLF